MPVMQFKIYKDGTLPESIMGGAWFQVEDPALPGSVFIRTGSLEGRLVCTGLTITSDVELAARDLRRIKLPDILEAIARPRKGPWLTALLHEQPTRARPGRRGYPDSHYRQVAKAYRRAKRQHPRAPIRALMAELDTSEPTVHRWLRTATEKGFLKGGGR